MWVPAFKGNRGLKVTLFQNESVMGDAKRSNLKTDGDEITCGVANA